MRSVNLSVELGVVFVAVVSMSRVPGSCSSVGAPVLGGKPVQYARPRTDSSWQIGICVFGRDRRRPSADSLPRYRAGFRAIVDARNGVEIRVMLQLPEALVVGEEEQPVFDRWGRRWWRRTGCAAMWA